MKTHITILALVFAILIMLSSIPVSTQALVKYGPRIDQLLINIFPDLGAELKAFEACDIDLVDTQIPRDLVINWSKPPYNETIVLDEFKELGMYHFDINNNLTMPSYPNWPSPTSYKEFRHAIAHMVDKPYIINTIADGYGIPLEAPVVPWQLWYAADTPVHAYDPAMACKILYDAGWRDSPNPNEHYNVHFPPGHPLAGQNLSDVMINGPHGSIDPGLIFYRRADDPQRSLLGYLLIYGDLTHLGLEFIGIPCDDNNAPKTTCYYQVMVRRDYHIYTGSWTLGRDPNYLYDSWYGVFNDPLWDEYVSNVKFAANFTIAEYYSHQACRRFGEQVFFIPIWEPIGYMAHKRNWHELNVEAYSVGDWWNLFCTYPKIIMPPVPPLTWGFKSDVDALNIIYSSWLQDWLVLDKVFETLIKFNPYEIDIDMPWMASDWTIGTWTIPETGNIASKISFTLKDNINWVNATNGAILNPVLPKDVKFTAQYVYDHVGWNYPAVVGIYLNTTTGQLKIEIEGNTVTFYEKDLNVWAFHSLGSLPIIPKFIYENIADPHGFTPGDLSIEQTLIGCGAFYYVSYNPNAYFLFDANRKYFKPIVPNIDNDPLIKMDWGIFKANVKPGDWDVNVLDLIVVANRLGWEGPPGNIPEDIDKDGSVNVLELIIVAVNLGASWDP